MKFDKKYFTMRVSVIYCIIGVFFVLILYNLGKRMFYEREAWQKLGRVTEKDSVSEPPARGNILSADGDLMASSLPDYKLYIDFCSGVPSMDDTAALHAKRDTLYNYIDTISAGLAVICPNKDAAEYAQYLKKGINTWERHYELCEGVTLNYLQFKHILELPFFNKGKIREQADKKRLVNFRSGLIAELRNGRKKPFGSLAKRTLGEMYGAKDSARSGLELAYDSLLRGKPGLKHVKKMLSSQVDIIDKPVQNGYDLVSTLDVNMQDICESALRDEMKALAADVGVVVLMEVKTGDVKAIVNLQRYDSAYYESRNFALASLMEPGSTFKTASIMVAMDDGYVKPTDHVNGEGGCVNMYGAKMKDHNWYKGGYHDMDVAHVLMVSSNIGVAKLIDSHYHNQPEKFVDGLKRVGIGTPLHLPFVGAADPQIRYPAKDRSNWPRTTIPWMSIGYETQIPPISTVTFYNAIANGGKMVKPRFVKGLSRGGEMVQEFPVEVIKQHICKDQTLKNIQEILERVVCDKEGLGKPAGNPEFHVSGKTGTAQIASSKGYGTEHLVSFCGYFPSEDPKYTCIVAIRHNFWLASGGGQAGVVFSRISQRVLSKHVTRELICASDSDTQVMPDIKNGWTKVTKRALNAFKVKAFQDNLGDWCSSDIKGGSVMLSNRPVYKKSVPNVIGMGARDAIFALEKAGMKVKIRGRGRVKTQSVPAGHEAVKGQRIELVLV